MPKLAPILLKTDDSLVNQVEFLAQYNGLLIDIEKIARSIRLYGSKQNRDLVFNAISNIINKQYNNQRPLLTFTGSGDFHHLSLILLNLANIFVDQQTTTANFNVQHSNKKITLIHIDNHPDWVRDPVSCGSWIHHALKLPFIDKIISLGENSKDLAFPEYKRANLAALKSGKLILFPLNKKQSFAFKNYGKNPSYQQKGNKLIWNTLNAQPNTPLYNLIKHHINTKYIYISLDKDVLPETEQITNWDNGNLSLTRILPMLDSLCSNYKLAGIDITGDYSTPIDSGNIFIRLLKKVERLLDQPKQTQSLVEIANINQKTNLQLLNILQKY